MLVERMLPAARGKPATVGIDAPLIDAAKLLQGADANLVIVCDAAGAMAGVITKTDIVARIGDCHGASCVTAASAVMTRAVTFCHPDSFVKDVWSTMKDRGLKHLPVTDRDLRPIGVINARQVVQALLEEVEYEEQLLRDYVMCIGYR
ncbi:CBS domain-containing protein [Constrictibacter sp. MBR-5]|uniref:CBS domain-containing protein n=1 Tax=Constrictibacter sp. MBR-5 TaxID=3156467 RepID=UPI0033945C87